MPELLDQKLQASSLRTLQTPIAHVSISIQRQSQGTDTGSAVKFSTV